MENKDRFDAERPSYKSCKQAKCEFFGKWKQYAVCKYMPGMKKQLMYTIDSLKQCPRQYFMQSHDVVLDEGEYNKIKAIFDEIREKDARREDDLMTRDESQEWLNRRQHLVNKLKRMGIGEKDNIRILKRPY